MVLNKRLEIRLDKATQISASKMARDKNISVSALIRSKLRK